MNKKYLPAILTIVSIFVSTLVWEKITLPYDTANQIHGEYSRNFYNPNNDTLRFVFFVSFTLITFLISYLFFNKDGTHSLKEVLFQKPLEENKKQTNFNVFIFVFIVFIIIEFLSLNFFKFAEGIDHAHDGMLLTPSSNAYYSDKLWTSSYIERGLFAQFGTVISWKLFGIKSIGLMHLTNLFFLFLNKILLVIICANISKNLLFDEKIKKIYFFILTILSISLVNYYDLSAFPERLFLFLLFFIIFSTSFDKKNKFLLSLFSLGLFSAASMFWYIDVGAYINFIILFVLIYFSIRKEFKKALSTFLGTIIGWIIFIFLLPHSEFNEFVKMSLSVYSTADYFNGLIFPTPFLSGHARSTRALLFIIFAGITTLIILFNKETRLNYKNKTLFLFLFVASLLVFKSALSRSDTPHIKVSIGFNLFLIYATVLYFLFYFIENKSKFILLTEKSFIFFEKKYIGKFLIFFLLILATFKTNISSIVNMVNFNSNIKNFINYKDNKYLSSDYETMISYYKNLIINEDCIQTLTNESTVPYLLNKPTCTQFYFMYPTGSTNLQKEFIKQLKKSKPKIILYKSDITTWDFSSKHAPILFSYIEQNYSFHSKFKFWTFYQIN